MNLILIERLDWSFAGDSGEVTTEAPEEEFNCKDTEFGCCLDEKTAGKFTNSAN